MTVKTTGSYGYFKWILFTSPSIPNLYSVVSADPIIDQYNNTYLYVFEVIELLFS
jgi:hypothetical protein